MQLSSSSRRMSRARARAARPERTQAVEKGPAHQHRPRAERQRLRDVAAAPHAAVEIHLELVAHHLDDLRQRADRRGHVVELPRAVVRHDDCRGAVLGGKLCVVRGQHALDHERPGEDRTQPVDVLPGHRLVELRIDVLAEVDQAAAGRYRIGEVRERHPRPERHVEHPARAREHLEHVAQPSRAAGR